MLSDQWIRLDYKHNNSTWVSDIVNYYYWYDGENKPVGISLNFEYANDFHYEISMDEWGKAAKLMHINGDLKNTEERLKKCFRTHASMFAFETFLKSNDIKFSKITFY